MAAVCYLIIYLVSGVWIARCLLPRVGTVQRGLIGAVLGLMLLMWLPALAACLFTFSKTAHGIALAWLFALCALAYILRDPRACARCSCEDRKLLKTILIFCVPLGAFSGYLQYTHTLMNVNGALYVGQSTYGDLAMHLSFVTSFPNSAFPPDYSIFPGESICYPFLMDSLSASLYLLGLPLSASLVLPGTLMMVLCYAGYLIFARRVSGGLRVSGLAACFFFLNGGLGFVYTLFDTRLGDTLSARLGDVLYGYYRTPTNHADQAIYNLRWSNVIADMMVPQRTILAGWCCLMPCLLLCADAFIPSGRNAPVPQTNPRLIALLGCMVGMLPMIHTHTFMAMGLASLGMMLFTLAAARKGERLRCFARWASYGAIAVALALPQLIVFTFSQAVGNASFLRFHFNWVNNVGTLRNEYFWFYLKNIGLPFLLGLVGLVLAVRDYKREGRVWTLCLLCGGAAIFIPAELIVFQPNAYDNNKLFYVWYMLFALVASDAAVRLYRLVRPRAVRIAAGALAVIVCFLSAGLTLAREAIGSYQVFSEADTRAAAFIEAYTQPGDTFITGTQHLNPVSSLAGRDIVCGPDLWLCYHGYNTEQRKSDIARFYADPKGSMDVLATYSVEYIYISRSERNEYDLYDPVFRELFVCVYDSDGIVIFSTENREVNQNG